uniref:hypothetical protein n=1 Tax=Escherichia coli TaxID=562 RepID=UPI0020362EC2|nr:hypothetical protein [Escherichia coli]
MDVYIKAFKSTLELFDELVSCDLLTKRNAFGKLEINPIFENHFEWIMSEAFEIVGNHLGYNVPQIRETDGNYLPNESQIKCHWQTSARGRCLHFTGVKNV